MIWLWLVLGVLAYASFVFLVIGLCRAAANGDRLYTAARDAELYPKGTRLP